MDGNHAQKPAPGSETVNIPRSEQIALLDKTIQGLFALGLKLEYCIALVDESPEQAKAGLDAALNGIVDLMEPLRDRIAQT
jgi:hypothetical protein